MNTENLLLNLNLAAQQLEKHCGVYDINILDYAIENSMDLYWQQEDNNFKWAEEIKDLKNEDGEMCNTEYKYIFRGDIYTVALLDASDMGADDYISILSTDKELK